MHNLIIFDKINSNPNDFDESMKYVMIKKYKWKMNIKQMQQLYYVNNYNDV